MLTGDEYRKSLLDGRETFFEGRRIDDLTTEPALDIAVRSVAAGYDRYYAEGPDAQNPLMEAPRSMDELRENGTDPADAMRQFADWLTASVPEGSKPVLVAFNAPFDWMFVDDAFQHHLGRNPFGSSALDMKAYYMGQAGVTWARTSMRFLSPMYLSGRHLEHNALADARDQAELFRALLAAAPTR